MNDNVSMTASPRRRWVLRVSGAVLLLCLLGLVLGALALLQLLDGTPVQLSINGHTLAEPLALEPWSGGHWVWAVLGVAVALLAVLVVVPLALVLAALGVVVGLVFGLGLPLLIVALLAAVALSPLALLGWLIWRAARPSPRVAA